MKNLAKNLIKKLLKKRSKLAFNTYLFAQHVIRVYENCEVDCKVNGEHWLQGLIISRGNVAVLDIGANCGEWLVPLLKRKEEYIVYAFEPAQAAFNSLTKAVDDSRVRLVNKAMSSKAGSIMFHESSVNTHVSSVYDNGDWAGGECTLKAVPATTGDVWIREEKIKSIDLVKIDVEGHDYDVLLGFSEAIRNGLVDFFQFEYNIFTLKAGKTLKDFFDFLNPGYLICRLLPNSLEAAGYHHSLENFRQSNWVAIRRDIINKALVLQFNIRIALGHSGKSLEKDLGSAPELLSTLQLLNKHICVK